MPYGYYTLLRLGLCVACGYYILRFRPPLTAGHRLVLGGLAVLYNPLIPVHLGSKAIWTFVNVATVAYFWMLELHTYLSISKQSRPATVPKESEDSLERRSAGKKSV
jgi:hypothetical protein